METLIILIAGIAGIIAIIFSDKFVDLKIKKELFKSNVAYNISCISGIISVLLLLVAAIIY